MKTDWLRLVDCVIWAFCILAFSVHLIKRTSLTVAIAFGVMGLSSLMVFENSLNKIPLDIIIRFYDMAALGALVSLLLTVLAVLSVPLKTWKIIFKCTALINAIWLIGGRTLHPRVVPMGILLNGSMSGCFAACLYPLFDDREKWAKRFIFLSVILVARSLPIAVIIAVYGSILIMRKHSWRVMIGPTLIGAIAFCFLKDKSFLNSDGRMGLWKTNYNYFIHYVSFFKGSGLGTFYIMGQMLSARDAQYTWLHSDWMQVFFETGLIGFVATLAMYIHALIKSKRDKILLPALIGFGVFAIANMPLRFPLAGLYGAFLIRSALEKRNRFI